MKNRTPKAIAAELAKLTPKIDKARKDHAGALSHLDYTIEQYAALPAELATAAAELQTATDATAQTAAELTKPLGSYSFNQDWRSARANYNGGFGHRRYASPAAQAAYDAQRAEHYARERYEETRRQAQQTEEEYIQDALDREQSARANLHNLTQLTDNLRASIAAIMGRELSPEEIAALVTAKPEKTAPAELPTVQARASKETVKHIGRDFLYDVATVTASTVAAALATAGNEVQIAAGIFPAKIIREWLKLEKSNDVKITVDAQIMTLFITSPDSRAAFKGLDAQERPNSAPALVFCTAE